MKTVRFLFWIDHLSTWSGKAFSWIILLLTGAVCVEVVKRYALNAPTSWIFSADYMMYGTMFMMAGAYTLAQNGHVRGDFLYGSMKPQPGLARPHPLHCLLSPWDRGARVCGVGFRARVVGDQ